MVLDPQVDVHQVGYGVASLLKAFPFERLRPTLIYYRHAGSHSLRAFLLRNGYSTSAHWETSYWGESNIAWRSDRCHLAGGGDAAPWTPLLGAPDVEESPIRAATVQDGVQNTKPKTTKQYRAPHIEL
jgi:hypothetical protein